MGGTSEAHAAIDADLPPGFASALDPSTPGRPRRTILSDLPGWCLSITKVPPEGVMVRPCPRLARGPVTRSWRGAWAGGARLPGDVGRDRHRFPARVDQGLAVTVMRPRAIAALAIAIHADTVDVPFGRFSAVLRAYTVKR